MEFPFELRDGPRDGVRNRRRGDDGRLMQSTFAAGSVRVDFSCKLIDSTLIMADATVGSFSSRQDTPFCQPANPGLHELIRGNAEKIGHTIEVAELPLADPFQKLTDPDIAVTTPLG